MELSKKGQKGGSNPNPNTDPAIVLGSLLGKKDKLQEDLRTIEKQVYELETSYLQDFGQFGNAFKGSGGILSSSKVTVNLKRSRKFQPEERLFSLSSVTSPASKELTGANEVGKGDHGTGRFKSGALPPSSHGRSKKARTST